MIRTVLSLFFFTIHKHAQTVKFNFMRKCDDRFDQWPKVEGWAITI